MTSPLLAAIAERLRRPVWTPYPWQVCPGTLGAQELWLIEGGRGIGKTDGCARYMDAHMSGPPCDPRIPGGHRAAIVAPTQDDAAESCVNGPSGLRAHNPQVEIKVQPGGTFAVWPNGARAKLFGAHTPNDVDRLRAGGNRCLAWVEEAAAMRHLEEAVANLRMGLRVGTVPHIVGSSTPRPTTQYKAFRSRHRFLTHATTAQADRLDPTVREELYRLYEGSRLGRQELLGELLEDVEGALWRLDDIDRARVATAPAALERVVVAVDPPATSTGDECGIVVVGLASERYYVLADLSRQATPEEWGELVCRTYVEWDADLITAEINQGGEMVTSVIRNAWRELARGRRVDRGLPAPRIQPVRAKRGKALRADPVAQLYSPTFQRVCHVGVLEKLEDQMTTWVPGEDDSPDRLDALVYGVLALNRPSGLELVVR